MDIIPVIDLAGGVVVHARGGQREAYRPIVTPLSASAEPPCVVTSLARRFPFRRLYVADLDAIEGRGANEAGIAALSAAVPGVEVWVDAGLGDTEMARQWLDRGGDHVLVIGSESQRDAAMVRALGEHPRVVLSLDFRGAVFQGPAELLADAGSWPGRVIVMTLARVGARLGPDLARVATITRRAVGRAVYAAGGVRNTDDLRALSAVGAAGALVATALHAGALSAEDFHPSPRPPSARPSPAQPPPSGGGGVSGDA